ncbi:hypothetical protein Tco_1133842 [Tanacetum coccineum]
MLGGPKFFNSGAMRHLGCYWSNIDNYQDILLSRRVRILDSFLLCFTQILRIRNDIAITGYISFCLSHIIGLFKRHHYLLTLIDKSYSDYLDLCTSVVIGSAKNAIYSSVKACICLKLEPTHLSLSVYFLVVPSSISSFVSPEQVAQSLSIMDVACWRRSIGYPLSGTLEHYRLVSGLGKFRVVAVDRVVGHIPIVGIDGFENKRCGEWDVEIETVGEHEVSTLVVCKSFVQFNISNQMAPFIRKSG